MLIRFAGRIAVWQAAAGVFALAAASGATWAMTAAGTLLGITVIRVRGRWLDRWFMIFMGYRSRARVRRAASALGVLAPRLATHEYRDPSGNQAGVLTDGPHWTVILRLDSLASAGARLIGVLLSAVDPAGQVRAPAVQLVRWAVPMPVDPAKPVGAGAGAPAWNIHWIAVRGQAPDAPSPAVTGFDSAGESAGSKATPSAAMRLATVLAAQGFAVRPLRESELSTELASSLGVAQAGSAVTARECWWSLSLGRLHHATYRLTRPPRDPARLARAMSWLAGPPSLSTCASLLFSAPSSSHSKVEVEIAMALRIAVPAGRSRREVRAALRRSLGPMASRARPMNGQHAEGVLTTIPMGGR